MIFSLERHPAAAIALVDEQRDAKVRYGDLRDRVAREVETLTRLGPPGLVVLGFELSVDAVVAYLACLEAGWPAVLVEGHEAAGPMAETYDAPYLRSATSAGFTRRSVTARFALHAELSLLLTTSGSTGNPKLVRLRRSNLEANAAAIVQFASLTPDERAILSLPLHYSYGLSVLNSHLLAGGTLVFPGQAFLQSEFWRAFDGRGCTSFAGVPFMYETLHRLRFDPAQHPTLRTLTQAGGALKPELTGHFHRAARAAGARLLVMYGQTEATARISYVPPERLAEKLGSIGIAIPGGQLELAPIADESGARELIYRGPNVMLGYAEGPEHLRLGDQLGSVLHTGDLAEVDADGFFTLRGRLARFAKLFGHRVSLEDVEREVERVFVCPAAAIERAGALVLFFEGAADPSAITRHLAAFLHLPPPAIVVITVPEGLPRTAAGKKHYRALAG